MKIKITENNRAHNFIDSIVGLIMKSLFYLIAIPILIVILIVAMISNLFQSKNKSKVEIKNDWIEKGKSENITIHRKFINENEIPDDINLPNEPTDVYLFEVRTVPQKNEFNGVYFDMNFIETAKAFYMISVNKIGNGMSLFQIEKATGNVEIVKELKSLWWSTKYKDGKIILNSQDNNTDYTIEINELE